MSEYTVYLHLPKYLAEWYAHHCREHHFMNNGVTYQNNWTLDEPIVPIKDSYESLVLKHYIGRQPSVEQQKKDEEHYVAPNDVRVAIALPYYKEKDPRTYNYLGPKAEAMLVKAIRDAFKIDLWEELYEFRKMRQFRQDEHILCYMENHHITDDGTAWDSIAKVYQRMRKTAIMKIYRKNRSTSDDKK